jgi:hypothetical protein
MQKWLNENRETVIKVLSHATVFFAGATIGSGIGLHALGKFQARVNERHKKIADAMEAAEEIMNDVTLSGEEREKKAHEFTECALILMREDLF